VELVADPGDLLHRANRAVGFVIGEHDRIAAVLCEVETIG